MSGGRSLSCHWLIMCDRRSEETHVSDLSDRTVSADHRAGPSNYRYAIHSVVVHSAIESVCHPIMSKDTEAKSEEIMESKVLWYPDSKRNTQMDRFRAQVNRDFGLNLGK